mgnify:CR=1 FL=1
MAESILIVDDDPVQRRLLEAAIGRLGLVTLTAPGGSPALDILFSPKADQISLMLLDLVMPDVDGLQVLTKLRAVNPDMPVIVLTAKGGIDSAVEAMRASRVVARPRTDPPPEAFRLLAVEDDAMILKLFHLMVSSWELPLELKLAHDGFEALPMAAV